LDSASKEIKVDIDNWINRTFRFSFGYKLNCPNCKDQNNGEFSEFVLNIQMDQLNLDHYLRNLVDMLKKTCSNCHQFKNEMVTITNLPEIFLIQIENPDNQQIEYGIEDIQITNVCES
jgi:formate-dependent nitrite reductase cytochrome c552 subunit